jgi:hypothetical protein
MLSHSKSVKDAFFDLPLKLLFQPSKLKISWHPMSLSFRRFISILELVVSKLTNICIFYKNDLPFSWLTTFLFKKLIDPAKINTLKDLLICFLYSRKATYLVCCCTRKDWTGRTRYQKVLPIFFCCSLQN